jgi:hypothetical protein
VKIMGEEWSGWLREELATQPSLELEARIAKETDWENCKDESEKATCVSFPDRANSPA